MSDSSDSSSTGGDSEEEYDFEECTGILPYQFEPPKVVKSDKSQQSASETSQSQQLEQDNQEADVDESASNSVRMGNTNWCTCNCCTQMDREVESLCCEECPKILKKMQAFDDMKIADHPLACITEHPGFATTCLDVWVLEVAYLQYCNQYHERLDLAQNEMFRYTAYRQIVRWCWGIVGRNHRVPLPSCVVTKIRDTFPNPDGNYTGFKWPQL